MQFRVSRTVLRGEFKKHELLQTVALTYIKVEEEHFGDHGEMLRF